MTLQFEHAEHSHISHFTYHLRNYIIIDHVLTSYIQLFCVYVNFKHTNQSCWSSKISLSINAEWRTCDRSFSESKKNFGRLVKPGTF